MPNGPEKAISQKYEIKNMKTQDKPEYRPGEQEGKILTANLKTNLKQN